jgi:hypothetical protein
MDQPRTQKTKEIQKEFHPASESAAVALNKMQCSL